MSASVFRPIHPIRIDMQRVRSSFGDKKYRPGMEKVRRSLFGPVDHKETQDFIERELAQTQEIQGTKWEFDFERGIPLYSDGRGRYIWKAIRQTASKITFAPKRKRCLDDYDNSHLYAQPLNEVKRPQPLRADENIQNVAECPEKKQMKITDFMQAKKRPGEPLKKLQTSQPPTKISRTSFCS